MKKIMKQTLMFETADLPLFSQTAQTVQAEVFQPQAEYKQEVFYTCPICKDTAYIQLTHGRYVCCTCNAGHREFINREIYSLSGSTLANLTGESDWKHIEPIQEAWANWVLETDQIFDCWQEAWQAWPGMSPD